jgi:hypothetical protein
MYDHRCDVGVPQKLSELEKAARHSSIPCLGVGFLWHRFPQRRCYAVRPATMQNVLYVGDSRYVDAYATPQLTTSFTGVGALP